MEHCVPKLEVRTEKSEGRDGPESQKEQVDLLASGHVRADRHRTGTARAAGFRNVIAHAYASLDMARVHRAASTGPADLRAFLRHLTDMVRSGQS